VQSNLACGLDEDGAIDAFCKKFRSKTGNAWDKRDAFAHISGKYDLVEIDEVRVQTSSVSLWACGQNESCSCQLPRHQFLCGAGC
jgi:hypothetical protein